MKCRLCNDISCRAHKFRPLKHGKPYKKHKRWFSEHGRWQLLGKTSREIITHIKSSKHELYRWKS